MPTPATSRPPPSPTASPGKWPDNGKETDMSILTGEDLVLGTFVPFQWLNYVKNNWRGATLDHVVPGGTRARASRALPRTPRAWAAYGWPPTAAAGGSWSSSRRHDHENGSDN